MIHSGFWPSSPLDGGTGGVFIHLGLPLRADSEASFFAHVGLSRTGSLNETSSFRCVSGYGTASRSLMHFQKLIVQEILLFL